MAYTTAQLLSALLMVDGRAVQGGAVELPPNARLLLDVIVEGSAPGALLDDLADAVAAAQTARDEAIAISGITGEDDAVAALVTLGGSDTRAALLAALAEKSTQTTVESGRLSTTSLESTITAVFEATNDLATASYITDPDSATSGALSDVYVPKLPTLARLRGLFATSRRRPVVVGMFGHSFVSGVGATRQDLRWVNQLAIRLQAAYPSGVQGWEPPVQTLTVATAPFPLTGINVINGGIAATYANNYIPSPSIAKITALQPQVCFHMIGTNDHNLGVTHADFQTALNAALTAVDAACTVPPIHVIVDTYDRLDATKTYPWSGYVTAMQAVADARPSSAVYIPVLPDFADADASGVPAADPLGLVETGRLHPSDEGHAFIAQVVAERLRIPPIPVRLPPDVIDRFARTALGNAETGQPWVIDSGAFVPDVGGLKTTTSGILAVETLFSDVHVSAVVTWATGAGIGVSAKEPTGASNGITAYLNSSKQLVLYVGATFSSFGSVQAYVVDGGSYLIDLYIKGTDVTGHLDGVKQFTYTLSAPDQATYAAYTRHGLRTVSNVSTQRWSSFSARRL